MGAGKQRWWRESTYDAECGQWTAGLSREAAHVLCETDGIETKLKLYKPGSFAITRRQLFLKVRW